MGEVGEVDDDPLRAWNQVPDLILEDGGNVGGQPAAAFDDGSIFLRRNAQPQAGRGNVGGIHSHKELYHGTGETQGAPFKTLKTRGLLTGETAAYYTSGI